MRTPLIRFIICWLLSSLCSSAQQALDLSTLTPEDQSIVKGLKFRDVKLAPDDSRTATYIKGSVQVANTSGVAPVFGKLKMVAHLLMKTPQKKWHVIKCTVDFVVPKKGNNDVYLSFNETNTKFEEATGDKKARPADTHYVIFYGAASILESEPAKAGKFPEEWWKKEGPLMEDSPPETAKPVAATTGVAEFDVIRRTFEQQLRAQAWRTYEQSVNELRTKYVAALDRAMKTSQTAGRLDEALELRQEKETVGQTGKVSDQADPASTPALITLRATHQIALIGLKEARAKSAAPVLAAYNQKTALLIQQLTQAGRLDAAKEVRDAKDNPLIADE